MNIIDLRDRVIEDGKASVIEEERQLSHVIGGLIGFEICRDLLTRDSFERVLRERQQREAELRVIRKGVYAAPEDKQQYKMALDRYWEYRMATAQVEWVYKVLCVAWGDPTVSVRALRKYAEIVGVASA